MIQLGLSSATLLAVAFLYSKTRQRFGKIDRTNARMRSELKGLRGDVKRVQREVQNRVREVYRGQESLLHYQLPDLMAQGLPRGVCEEGTRSPRLVVSLTTIPQRLFEISATVESLLRQTLKPDVIVLWLDRERMKPEDIPVEVQRQTERGLLIRYVQDVGPHTKLVPALKEYPDDVVITVDDDILYPSYLVEILYSNYLKDPTKIYCTRSRHMTAWGAEMNYLKDWPDLREEAEGLDVFPLGVGGVLYPPKVLHEDVFDLESQKSLCPMADDVWFKTMSLRRSVVCKRVAMRAAPFPIRAFSQEHSLDQTNVHGGRNEKQIRACFERYGIDSILENSAVAQD